MDQSRIAYLINGYLAQSLSPDENVELDDLIKLHPSLPKLLHSSSPTHANVPAALEAVRKTNTTMSLDLILGRITEHQASIKRRNRRLVIIFAVIFFAVILIIIAVTLYKLYV